MNRGWSIAMKKQASISKFRVKSALLAGLIAVIAPSAVLAQQNSSMAMPMDHSTMQGMDHSAMPMMKKDAAMPMDHSTMPSMDHGAMPGMSKDGAMPMDHSKMQGMDHSTMPGMSKDGAMPMDHSKMQGMDHSTMPGMSKGGAMPMDHSKMPGMDHSAMPGMGKDGAMPMDHSKMPGMDHSTMPGMGKDGAMPGMGSDGAMKMDMGAMQGGPAPADARNPDAYADGLTLGTMPGMHMADNALYGQVLLDRLEWTHTNEGSGQALDAQAWFGGDLNKLWLKVDGERSGGKLGATRTEALWNHAVATYWGLQTGIRHDLGDGPSRNWAAFGVQGLAPYWFDLQATAYVGGSGRTAARVEAEYDVLLTQRLILQPNVKADFYGRQDRERGIGSGLSDMEAGLRLRYEITRKIAPYVGVVWKGSFGDTANFAREAGKRSKETQVVAGVRLWF
jgi:copper resistance protein B